MRKAIFIFIAIILVAASIDWIHSCAELKSHKEVFGRYLTYADMYEYKDKDYDYVVRVQEDDVWQKSQVDPVVKQLEAADKQQDAYMTACRYINDGYAALPDGEAQKTDALVVQRTFKDFKFRVNDGYGAEADKILQMGQNLQTKPVWSASKIPSRFRQGGGFLYQQGRWLGRLKTSCTSRI